MLNNKEQSFPCPVCGCMQFSEPSGSYEICAICGWEDDPVQAKHPRMRGGANGGSIFDYQQNSEVWSLKSVLREEGWRPLNDNECTLENGEVGVVDYTLDYYQGRPPYYWRYS